MDSQQERNPARARLQQPFLKRAPPRSHTPAPDPPKKPFCKAAIAVKQSAKKAVEYTPPQSSSKPSNSESEEVDRQLVRKKSELLSLNLKCIELQEKYGVLLEKSKRSSGCWEQGDCSSQVASHTEDGHPFEKRADRLLAIKTRLQSLDFTNCCRMAVSVRR